MESGSKVVCQSGDLRQAASWLHAEGGAMRATFVGEERDDDDALTLKAKAQIMLK